MDFCLFERAREVCDFLLNFSEFYRELEFLVGGFYLTVLLEFHLVDLLGQFLLGSLNFTKIDFLLFYQNVLSF